MPYETLATRNTPALIIYLLDMSDSMNAPLGNEPKIDVVNKTLRTVVREMMQRSRRGSSIAPRYRIAIFAYNDEVRDLFDGTVTIDQFLNQQSLPVMKASSQTDTARAFLAAEAFLQQEWSKIQHCPAPLICHMTDGEYTGDDPLPIARRLMQMSHPDGNVLIENIFLDSNALSTRVDDPYSWPGIWREGQLASKAARHLFQMSSEIPTSYLGPFRDKGYSIHSDARLLFPGDTPEMAEAGFMMSGMTPTV